MKFYFFSDGASEPTNPGPSSFAFLETSEYHDKRELYSYYEYIGFTTNNVAELRGLKAIFEYIIKNKDKYLSNSSNEIFVYSDSQYALDCIRKWFPNWVIKNKLADKKNLDIIKPAYEMYCEIQRSCSITLEWVKGHNGHWANERADELCNIALFEAQISTQTDDPIEMSILRFNKLVEDTIELNNKYKSNIKKLVKDYIEIKSDNITEKEMEKLISKGLKL